MIRKPKVTIEELAAGISQDMVLLTTTLKIREINNVDDYFADSTFDDFYKLYSRDFDLDNETDQCENLDLVKTMRKVKKQTRDFLKIRFLAGAGKYNHA